MAPAKAAPRAAPLALFVGFSRETRRKIRNTGSRNDLPLSLSRERERERERERASKVDSAKARPASPRPPRTRRASPIRRGAARRQPRRSAPPRTTHVFSHRPSSLSLSLSLDGGKVPTGEQHARLPLLLLLLFRECVREKCSSSVGRSAAEASAAAAEERGAKPREVRAHCLVSRTREEILLLARKRRTVYVCRTSGSRAKGASGRPTMTSTSK